MSADILRLLRDDEIHTMIDRFSRDLPNSVLGYNFLRMYIKWKQIINEPTNNDLVSKLTSDTVWRTVYTKRDGVAENCTIVSISGERDLTIFIFSYDPNEIKQCIEHTNLINWAKGPAFAGFSGKHHQNMVDIVRRKGLALEYNIPTHGYYLPRDAALNYKIDLPDDVRLDSIQEKDYDVVDKLWTYCYPGSDQYIKCLILLNDNFAIYSKDTNEIKCWVITDEMFSLAMLHTKSDFTRKGYASLVIKSLARSLAQKYDMGTFCFITHGNSNSQRCFTKLGFQKVDVPEDLFWVKVIQTDL